MNFSSKKINLENLKEVYQQFKFQFPDVKVEFLKFAELCPKHCVLAGASGTYTVAMCLHYSPEHKANDDCWKINRV